MYQNFSKFLTYLGLAAFLLLWGPRESTAQNRPRTSASVVLITLDGFPAWLGAQTNISIPNIRRLARDGVVADGMAVANPSITWPNHTTLITGVSASRHSVLFNGILKRGNPGEPLTVDGRKDKSELVRGLNLLDIAHAKGLRTAAINWPCTRNSSSIDDDFPDSPETLTYTTPRLKQELVAKRILSDANDATFRALSGPARDEVWTQAACEIIRNRKPHFLVLHLLNTDGIHHRYGPASPASYTAITLADAFVGRVMEAVAKSGNQANTTIFVTSDHGFASATNLLYPNTQLRKAGLLEVDGRRQITKAEVQVISEGGTGFIYLLQNKEANKRKVLELFSGKQGVERIIEPHEYARHGYPSPETNQGMPDLVLVAKHGYAVSAAGTGDDLVQPIAGTTNLGYHGFLAENDRMNALFVAAGRGIRKGARLGVISNFDVAPTIAQLLGLQLPESEGKPLLQILTGSTTNSRK